MTSSQDLKARPFSADVTRPNKVRLQSSNCPTIVKHEVPSPLNNLNAALSPNGADKAMLSRPMTANNATQMKFAFLQSIRPVSSPMSAMSVRPQSGFVNSSINFDFVNAIGKNTTGKFQDKSKIKAMKKLDTAPFHSIIYKVKHQKELLEKDINRMEQWQKEFKENDVWNTPQAAIIDSILKMNAKANPDGSISRYLQIEKDKEDTMRSSRKMNQRPSSSFAFRKGAAKSVKEFFRSDENDEAVIEEILTTKNPYYNQYDANKKRITERLNNYVDSYGNLNALKTTNRDIHSAGPLSSNHRDTSRNWKPYEEIAKDGYSAINYTTEENLAKSISQIVESNENSESSPVHLPPAQQYEINKTSDFHLLNESKVRPNTARMNINTTLSPKNFNPNIRKATSPGSLVIHTRPQTAKQLRVATSGSIIASGLAANGEARGPTVSSIKYMPFTLEGHKIGTENQDMNSYNGMIASAKNLSAQNFDSSMKFPTSTKSAQNIWPGSSGFKFTPTRDVESASLLNRSGKQRLMSAKGNSRPTTATQSIPEYGLSLGKVNIDGQYLTTFGGTKSPVAN